MSAAVNNNVYDLKPTKKKLRLVAKNKAKLTLLLIHNFEHQIANWKNIFHGHFSIKTATDGVEALKIILDEKIDLIISSTELTGITGLEVCKFVKQHTTTEHIQMIFVSDHYSVIEEEQALSLGAIDYISAETKPKILFKRVKNQMKLVKHSKELEHVSKTDALTGIANRMWFDNQLKEDWQAAIRGEGEVSLIMIDIDHFKLYNDEFGHIKGDECLTKVAQCLVANNKRSNDLVARFGGEEFVVLLPFTDTEGAKKIAADLVKAVNELNIEHSPKASHKNVTISAGVASYSPNFANENNFGVKNFIERADLKLYQAKKHGRNQFCY